MTTSLLHKSTACVAALSLLALFAASHRPAAAQTVAKPAAATAAAKPTPKPQASPPTLRPTPVAAGDAPPPAGGWAARCTSEARGAALDCAVEQNAYVSNTGQLVASFRVRLASDTRQPAMLIQVPLGLYLPGGVTLQVDDGTQDTLPIQTCDQKGCFAAAPLSADKLAAMKGGRKLNVGFEGLNRQVNTITFVLDSFAEAYRKVE